MLIKNASAVMKNCLIKRDILIKNGRIADIAPEINSENEKIIDADGLTLVPGFIDEHTHGAVGYVYSNSDADIKAMCAYEASEGVTTVASTLHAMTAEDFRARCSEQLAFFGRTGGAKIGGFHAEGPFLNTAKKGAMNPKRIAEPSIDTFDRMFEASEGQMKLITLAPEMPGALELIKHAVSKGVMVSAGHTDASYDEMMRAIDAGVTRMTHTFNACRALNHRDPGVLGAAFTDKRVTCEVICDFGHLHPAAVNLVYQIKGSAGFCAISDSEFAPGLKSGSVVIDGEIRIIDNDAGVCRLADGTICGSASTLYRGFKNLVSLGIPIWEVSEMCSANPAKALGIYGKTGSIEVGKCADLVLLDQKLNIKNVFVDGEAVR